MEKIPNQVFLDEKNIPIMAVITHYYFNDIESQRFLNK
jgi:hypothetical protein